MKVIINADDFGLTLGNTQGIYHAHKHGIVTSTTAMMNSPHIKYAEELSKQCPDLGVGIHLTLTSRKPLTNPKTLVDENGNFFRKAAILYDEHDPDYDEIYAEWKAQMQKFISVFHRMPTHIDSHHHVHDWNDKALAVAQRLADEYGLKMRRHCEYTFVNEFYDDISKENLIKVLEKYKGQDIEIMCHPGCIDLELYRISSYCNQRIKELDVFCDPEVIQYCKDNDIELIHF